MRRRILIASIPISLFLLLFFATAALASSPSSEPPPPASVTTAADVEAAGGPIPGCPPAKHRSGLKVPADGGRAIRVLTGPVIFFAWWNNGHPSVVDERWNPGEPPWGQKLIKFKIPGGVKLAIRGAGGEYWKYANNRACRHNLKYEFERHARNLDAKSYKRLIDLGLARRRN
jgi:hypothetical protein